MVNLTRIYTKTGDDGTTSLGDMSRTSKNDPRLEAYATVDEANSSIGVAIAMGGRSDDAIHQLLIRIQNDLFDVGADLCTPIIDNPPVEPLRVSQEQIDYLESQIDLYNEDLSPLRSYCHQGLLNQRSCTLLAQWYVGQSDAPGTQFTPLEVA